MATNVWDEFQIEPLSAAHDRSTFSCGVEALDDFLKKYAKQNEKRDLTRTYVLEEKASKTACGFSSVRFGQVSFDVLPEAEQKRVARYPIPTFLIARFAIDKRHQGKRLGELLLLHSLRLAHTCADQAGLYAIEVEAKTETAAAFYGKYGFSSLEDEKLHMYLSMKAVRRMFSDHELGGGRRRV